MSKRSIRERIVQVTPVRFVTVLAVSIFATEVGSMSLLSVIVPSFGGGVLVAIADALMVIAILVPVLWWIVVRPLRGDVVAEHDRSASLVAILEATPDLVGIADPAGRLVYVNRGGRKMVGLDERADLSGQKIGDFYDAANTQMVLTEAIPTAVRDGSWSGDTELMARDGHVVAVSQVILAHKKPDGTVAATSTIARDITERKRAEASRLLLATAVEQAAEMVVIVDAAGTIVYVNPVFEKITQYTSDDAIGQNSRILKSGKQDAEFYRSMWATLTAGEVWSGYMINKRKDGTLYDEESTISPVRDAAGTIVNYVAVKHDVSERTILEARLRQSLKMESVGQLASGIAHDFNNLLTVINGTAELLLQDLREDDPVRADLQEVHSAGQLAAGLTRQLLAFSRKQILEPRVMNINAVAVGMESLLQRLLGEDINIVVVRADGVGNVKADRGQIEQVITNLAVNARDAMPQGGALTIETLNVTIDERFAQRHGADVAPGRYVLLTVTDTGVGMDEATRARVFEPFFTTKDLGKGTGLGLSTVYGIVKQSQGFIWAYSEVGTGTCFKVYLPQVADALTIDLPQPTAASRACTETILVLEDNDGLRRLATRLLTTAGYTVIGANGGRDALRLLERDDAPVHLLLTDVVMPDMSGPQAAELLTRMRPAMKVLYMSGYTGDAVVRHGVLESETHFLGKPFTAADLLRKVSEALADA